jgi:probable phosphoglycerate mutase
VTLVLVARHGETDWNAEHRFQGHADQPLNARGRAQAEALADLLDPVPLAAVVSSDLVRARDTAELVAARHGLSVRVEPELREVDVGTWTGRTEPELRKAEPEAYARWRTGLPGWIDGETYEQMAVRVVEALLRVAAEYEDDGRPILLVGHGATIRAYEAATTGEDQQAVRRRRYVVANGSLGSVEAGAGGLSDFRAEADLGALVGSPPGL